MKDRHKNNTVKKAGVILLLIASLIIISIIAILCLLFFYDPSEYGALEKTGSQWVSDDGNISFTVYHEIGMMPSAEDKDTIIDISDGRYMGFGQMATESETVDISCILSDTKILMGLFGYSANYTDISNQSYVDIAIKEISNTEVIATVTRIRHEADWFSYDVGDEIRLTQINDVSSIDISDYEFFIDAIEQHNAASTNTEITIYKREDIADKLKDFEERQVDNTAE